MTSGQRGSQRPPAGLLAFSVALLLAGCTSGGAPVTDPASASVLEALELAEQQGDAAPEQAATLEQARDEGRDVTEEEYRAAYGQAVECARASGVTVVKVHETYDAGTLQMNMEFNVRANDEDAKSAIVGDCEHRFSSYLDIARQLSSTAIAAQDAIIADHLPAMLRCVRDKGANLDDDATYDEIISEDPDLSDPERSCVVTTGLQAALNAPAGP